MPTLTLRSLPVRSIQPPEPLARAVGVRRGKGWMLCIDKSPENGKFWVTADRLDSAQACVSPRTESG